MKNLIAGDICRCLGLVTISDDGPKHCPRQRSCARHQQLKVDKAGGQKYFVVTSWICTTDDYERQIEVV